MNILVTGAKGFIGKNLIATLKTPLYKTKLSYDLTSHSDLKESNFVVKGDICYSKNQTELTTIENGYLVCVNGMSVGCFEKLPSKYKNLPLIEYVIPKNVDTSPIYVNITV